MTHGAGSNRDADLLVALDQHLTGLGHRVERINLAFRVERPMGPPRRSDQERDRACLRDAVKRLRSEQDGAVWIGGHSYGGRMASMLVSAESEAADGLLLLGYPLHPPKRPDEPRTAHWPSLRCPLVFVSGARDAFGTPGEFETSFATLPSWPTRRVIEGAGHDLKPASARSRQALVEVVRIIADVWHEALNRR